MDSIHRPIPLHELPPGWGPANCDDERLVYRFSRSPIELVASTTRPDRANPTLGLGRCWELRVRHAIGELQAVDVIGRVSTRSGARDSLLRCMHLVNETVDQPEDPMAVRSALDRVALEDLVPGDDD